MELENVSIWYWIIPVLVGLACALIGYLWGKGRSRAADLEVRIKALEGENARLIRDLKECSDRLAEASYSAAPDIPFDAKAAKAAFGRRVKEDDLKIVEGIGPKIENLFHNFDVRSWKALSELSVVKCQEVLDSGGDRFRVHDPASWPMQARMAYEGRWKDLARWQDEHQHGKL